MKAARSVRSACLAKQSLESRVSSLLPELVSPRLKFGLESEILIPNVVARKMREFQCAISWLFFVQRESARGWQKFSHLNTLGFEIESREEVKLGCRLIDKVFLKYYVHDYAKDSTNNSLADKHANCYRENIRSINFLDQDYSVREFFLYRMTASNSSFLQHSNRSIK